MFTLISNRTASINRYQPSSINDDPLFSPTPCLQLFKTVQNRSIATIHIQSTIIHWSVRLHVYNYFKSSRLDQSLPIISCNDDSLFSPASCLQLFQLVQNRSIATNHNQSTMVQWSVRLHVYNYFKSSRIDQSLPTIINPR